MEHPSDVSDRIKRTFEDPVIAPILKKLRYYAFSSEGFLILPDDDSCPVEDKDTIYRRLKEIGISTLYTAQFTKGEDNIFQRSGQFRFYLPSEPKPPEG
jgi:hypothetical protein